MGDCGDEVGLKTRNRQLAPRTTLQGQRRAVDGGLRAGLHATTGPLSTPVDNTVCDVGFAWRGGAAVAIGGAASCLRDEGGTPQGWFITGQDLRGAVAAEASLTMARLAIDGGRPLLHDHNRERPWAVALPS